MGFAALTLFLTTIMLKDPRGYIRAKYEDLAATFGQQQAELGLGIHVNVKAYIFTNNPELCAKHRCWCSSCIYCFHGDLEPLPRPADYINPNAFPLDTDELLSRFLTAGDRAVLAKPEFQVPLESIGLAPGDPSSEADLLKLSAYNITSIFSIPNEYRFFLYFVQYKARALLRDVSSGAGEHAVLLSFLNGDIVFRDNTNFVRSIATVMRSRETMLVPGGPVLMTGQRVNVVAPSDRAAGFFMDVAQDYFVMDSAYLDAISPLPRSKIGGVLFDNWLTKTALHVPNATGVDLSLSAIALHVYTDPAPFGSHRSPYSAINLVIHRKDRGRRKGHSTHDLPAYLCVDARVVHRRASTQGPHWPMCSPADGRTIGLEQASSDVGAVGVPPPSASGAEAENSVGYVLAGSLAAAVVLLLIRRRLRCILKRITP